MHRQEPVADVLERVLERLHAHGTPLGGEHGHTVSKDGKHEVAAARIEREDEWVVF